MTHRAIHRWAGLGTAVLLGVAATAVTRASVTIDFTAQTGQRHVVDHDGEPVPDNVGEVRIGVLDDGFDLVRHGNDLQRVQEAWTQLGTTRICTILGEESRFSARTVVEDPSLTGRKVYLWILTTRNRDAVEPDFSNVRDHGIFSSTSPSWQVPSGETLAPLNSTLIHSSQVDESFGVGTITSNSLQLSRPSSAGMDYYAWEETAFPVPVPDADRSPLADPDRDGLVNLMEQFMGSDPMTAGPLPFETHLENGAMIIRFQRAKDSPAGAGAIFLSDDLQHWSEAGTAVETVAVEDRGSHQIVAIRVRPDRIPATWRSVFARLEVRQ